MRNDSEAPHELQAMTVMLDAVDDTKVPQPDTDRSALSASDGVIYIPLPDFFKAPDQKAVLNIKNNAPLTNPAILITEVAANWNYVDSTGAVTRVGTSRVSPNTPPGGTGSLYADQNGCVRNLTFQVTVGIPELKQYVKLDPIAIPAVLGCIVTINLSVGTGG